jgi:hypothetical protein
VREAKCNAPKDKAYAMVCSAVAAHTLLNVLIVARLVGELNTVKQVKHYLGMLFQLLTPLIVVFQLFYGFKLIVMPISLLIGITLFSIGTMLRESA